MQNTNKDFTAGSLPSVCFNMNEKLGAVYDDMYTSRNVSSKTIVEKERYQIKNHIATGGLKEVYCAFDRKTQRDVAIAYKREDLPDQQSLDDFLRESTITALLEHPNIIPVYDVGVEEKPFFTMKLVSGKNLQHFLFKEQKKFSRIQLLKIFIKICDAVAYAHSRGIIHLDLKPDNIKLNDYGEVLLHDWGLAKRIFVPENDNNIMPADEIEINNYIQGTPSYMAPEQFSGNTGLCDHRTDVYSLGGILYSILTAKPPFDSTLETNPLNREIINPTELRPKRNIPESLIAVSLKAMSKDAEDRYQTVTELQKEIERYLDGFATDAESAGFLKQFSLLVKRNKKICGLIAAALILISLTIYLFFNELAQEQIKTQKALTQAQISQKETAEALTESKINFEKYKKEKDEKDRIANKASESISNLYLMPDLSNYKNILKQIEIALEASPDNPSIYKKKVLTHIFYEEFNQAVEDYRLSSKEVFLDKAMPILKKYGALKKDKERLNEDDFISLILELEGVDNRWIAGAISLARLKSMRGKKQRIDFMKKTLMRCNPKQENWHWDFQSQDGHIFNYISFKGHKKLNNFIGLAGRYISVLDLTDCGRVYPQDLSLLFVKKIILKGCQIRRIQKYNDINGLEEIVVDKGQLPEEEMEILDDIKVIEE